MSRQFRAWFLISIVAAVLLNGAVWVARSNAPYFQLTLSPDSITKEKGHAFLADIARAAPFPYDLLPDTRKAPRQSGVILTESGRPLGPAHSEPDLIRSEGGGRYSFWKGTLYFSTSDGSDPRFNGHRYEIAAPLVVRLELIAAAAFPAMCAAILLIIWLVRSGWGPFAWLAPLAVASAVLYILCLQLAPGPVISPDTMGYLSPALEAHASGDFQSTGSGRQFVYPVFLLALLESLGTLGALPEFQFLLVIATAVASAVSLAVVVRWSGNADAGGAGGAILIVSLAFAVLAFQPLTKYAQIVIPEIPYAFLATVSVCLFLILLFTPLKRGTFVILYPVAVLVAGLAAFTKPHWAAAAIFIWLVLTIRAMSLPDLPKGIGALLVGATVSAAYLLLILPQQGFAAGPGKLRSGLFVARTLFCNHADLVLPVLKTPRNEERYGAPFIRETHRRLQEIVAEGPTYGWNALGFNGDQCSYRGRVTGSVVDEFGGDLEAVRRFYLSMFFRAVANDPPAYVGKVLRQIYAVLDVPLATNAGRTISSRPHVVAMERRFPRADALVAHSQESLHPARELFSSQVFPPVLTVWLVQKLLDLSAWGLWALGLLAFLADRWLHGGWREPVRRAAPLALTLGVFLAGTAVVALAHTFDIRRYSIALAPVYVIAAGACIAYVASVAAPLWSKLAAGSGGRP